MFTRRLQLAGGADTPAQVADFVGELARRAGLPPRRAYWLRLAADEITTNIAQHGYRGRGGVVELIGGVEPDRVWVRIEDEAPPFDPHSHDPAPLLAVPPQDREKGGYGLLLVRGKLDEFSHDNDGRRNRNLLVMLRQAGDTEPTPEHGGTDGRDDGVDRR
jgi:anti-sigma regulatory factor (Ser/Thr protein kinase)